MASNLIVMLTHHDRTVKNAAAVFSSCARSKAMYFGIKEDGLPLDEMKQLYACMKAWKKTTVLEVVAYTEAECLAGARMAVECGCDILMGTLYFDSVHALCQEHGLKYMPFVGKVTGRPSVLEGTISGMIEEANKLRSKGVWGFDLLGYRYIGDPVALNKAFVSQVDAPVCIAGSVDSYQRLDELKRIAPWSFTIGGAFFEGKFGNGFAEQIDSVCDYMHQ